MVAMGFWGEPALCIKPNYKYLRQCTRGDVESFFMLFFDNFSSLLGILGAMVGTPILACGFDFTYSPYFAAYTDMVFRKVCPGIGCALLFGNLWYAWMAAKLSTKENGRMDVTALPYGINTPAGFLTVFAVMLPTAFDFSPQIADSLGNTKLSPADYAWKCFTAGCAANFFGGCIEVAGIVLGEFIRKNVPRAALFGPICGVGFVWLGFNPLIEVCREPIIGMLPLALCFTGFFAKEGKGCYGMVPVAVIIFVVGTTLWWCGLARWDTETRVDGTGDLNEVDKMGDVLRAAAEAYVGKNEWSAFACLSGFSLLGEKPRFFAIQIPIAAASFLETIENVEAASLEGDAYNVYEAMLADGLGTMFGAAMGAVMPTTVYIGHRRHKMVGATAMYSVLNGIIYFIFMFSGITGMLFYLIDPVSIGVILIAVGLMIVQQALEHSAPRHYPALMIGIMFVVADMVYFDHFDYTASVTTRSLGRMQGVANMAPGGGIICSIMVPAILCDLTDCRFLRCSVFCFLAMVFSLFGLMHGNNGVFYDGQELHVHGKHSYELGEVMLSTETYATMCNAGPTCPYPFTVAPPNTSEGEAANTYFINHVEAGWPPMPTPRSTAFNEGWRFAVAYAFLCVFCLLHHAAQMAMCKGKCDATMDNGVASPETGGMPSVKQESAEA